MGQQSDKVVKRWFSDPAIPPDASLDESLRQVGADLLGEPVPERLLQALYGTGHEAEGSRGAELTVLHAKPDAGRQQTLGQAARSVTTARARTSARQ